MRTRRSNEGPATRWVRTKRSMANLVALRNRRSHILTDTIINDQVELLVMKIDDTLADIGNINVVETSKMIDVLLDMRLVVLSMKN